MIDDQQRPRYWLYTSLLAGAIVVLAVILVFVLPLFTIELNADTFLSFPLGYFLAAQGIVIALIIAVYWAGERQAETDSKFGASEDM